MLKPYGMIPALPTPLNDDYSINFEGVTEVVNHAVDNGMDGVLVGGSTGEYSLMSVEERKSVIQHVCETAGNRVPVMAGTGCHRTEDTIELTQFAEKAGASFALVINPYYMPTSDEGIIEHYRQVAESVEIGIVIYHYPDATGVTMPPELLKKISEIEGVVGIKNTADGQHTSELIGLTKDDENFSVLTGFEHLILATFAMGGHGAIGVVHNLVPKELSELYQSVKDNDLNNATRINQKLLQVYSAMEAEPVPGTVKAGLEAIGLPGGPSRRPLVSASNHFNENISKILSELNN
ncbi:4-hydroxy-tetrahydrodipicolinate synthase [Corticicoccus populi]|uniref:4-hydroxy-tetrahydrodipicolinate synthase n=1 Tax=Corticicoccus populi TaxID=1812821 RepID=A0ABW5WZS5_9STAP